MYMYGRVSVSGSVVNLHSFLKTEGRDASHNHSRPPKRKSKSKSVESKQRKKRIVLRMCVLVGTLEAIKTKNQRSKRKCEQTLGPQVQLFFLVFLYNSSVVVFGLGSLDGIVP